MLTDSEWDILLTTAALLSIWTVYVGLCLTESGSLSWSCAQAAGNRAVQLGTHLLVQEHGDSNSVQCECFSSVFMPNCVSTMRL